GYRSPAPAASGWVAGVVSPTSRQASVCRRSQGRQACSSARSRPGPGAAAARPRARRCASRCSAEPRHSPRAVSLPRRDRYGSRSRRSTPTGLRGVDGGSRPRRAAPRWPPPGASPLPDRNAGGAGSLGRCSGSREWSPYSADTCASCPPSPGEKRRSCAAEAFGLALGAAFGLVAELDLATHARAGRDRQGPCLDVAVDDARLVELDPPRVLDVPDELAGDAHDARLDLPFEPCAGIAAHIPVDVHIDGNVSLDAGARLEGQVKASVVSVAGELIGNIENARRVELHETGVINGDVKAGSLTVAAGSRMRGQVEFGYETEGRAKSETKGFGGA